MVNFGVILRFKFFSRFLKGIIDLKFILQLSRFKAPEAFCYHISADSYVTKRGSSPIYL